MIDTKAALAAGLERLRDRNAIAIGKLRLGAAVLWSLVDFVVGNITGRPELLGTLPVLLGYSAVAAVLLVLLQRSPRLRANAHALHSLVDMPILFTAQWVGIEYATNKVGIAYLTAPVLCVLLVAGQLVARPRHAIAETGVAVLGLVLLVWHAGAHPATAAGPALALLLVATALRWATRELVDAIAEATRTEAMRERLSRYLSPSVRDAVLAEGIGSASSRREVTVLMSDLRGFTSLAEKMDSVKLAAELNEYFKAMVEVVFRHQGTLDKFIGDGMLVYFGAPLANERHAESAVKCALDMQVALEQLNQTRVARGDPPLKMGIGINCGFVVCGDLGPPERVEYTIIGDTVNVTARMESLTKKLGVTVLASEEVQRRAATAATFVSMPPTEVPGKAEPLRTFSVS